MSKRLLQPIQDQRVRLRLIDKEDLPMTLSWRNRDDIRKWFIHSQVIAPEQHQAWFESYQKKDNDFLFIIEDVACGGKAVGQISIYNIRWDDRTGEYGRLIIGEPASVGKGLAKAATQLILTLAVEQLELREIYLEVFVNNQRAQTVYRDCGFTLEGQHGDLLRMIYIPSTNVP